jgi:hypothetical protein
MKMGEKQQVYLGQARNGAYGLFTRGFLAWGLGGMRPTEAEAKQAAERAGFEYMGSHLSCETNG